MWVVCVACLVLLVPLVRWLVKPFVQSLSNPPPLSYSFDYAVHAAGEDDRAPLAAAGAEAKAGDGRRLPFTSVYEPAEVDLSLIVPAYNEEGRLHPMMDAAMKYLLARQAKERGFTFEVIIVNDGSKDDTSGSALRYVRRYGADKVRLLVLEENQGKGGAVQQGMLHARGEHLLMVDADGATEIEDLDKVEQRLRDVTKDGMGIAVGSRAHLEDDAVATRKWYRNLLMYGFHFAVWLLCVRGVRDTQCGFKLFTRRAARVLFANMRLRRWSFDVELLHMAQRLGNIPIAEVAVRWDEIPGSHLDIFWTSLQMGRDLIIVRGCYTFGLWTIDTDTGALAKTHLMGKKQGNGAPAVRQADQPAAAAEEDAGGARGGARATSPRRRRRARKDDA